MSSSLSKLTEEHRRAIAESWLPVRNKAMKDGPHLFYVFFKNFPDYQNLFKHLKGVPLKELKMCPELWTHGVRVLYNITAMVDMLEESDDVVNGVMEKVIESHFPRGISEKHFKDLFSIWPEYMRDCAGEEFTETAQEGWKLFLMYLLDLVKERMK